MGTARCGIRCSSDLAPEVGSTVFVGFFEALGFRSVLSCWPDGRGVGTGRVFAFVLLVFFPGSGGPIHSV